MTKEIKDDVIFIRVGRKSKALLKKLAKEDRRKLSAYCRNVLVDHARMK